MRISAVKHSGKQPHFCSQAQPAANNLIICTYLYVSAFASMSQKSSGAILDCKYVPISQLCLLWNEVRKYENCLSHVEDVEKYSHIY